jgi:hypothetical protein
MITPDTGITVGSADVMMGLGQGGDVGFGQGGAGVDRYETRVLGLGPRRWTAP